MSQLNAKGPKAAKGFTVVKGFTMIELIFVLIIGAILVTLAAPNFSDLLKKNRLTNKTNDIVVAAGMARQTAVARGLTTFVCHSNNADTASPTCNGGDTSNWSKGFLIYTVPARTLVTAQRNYVPATDALILQTALVDDGVTVIDNNSNADNFMSFSGDGLLFGSGPIDFHVCDDRADEEGRTIKISASGRVSSGAMTCT